MTDPKKEYGYWDRQNDDDHIIYGKQGVSMSGYSLGIIALEVGYPLIPGNVVNACTYDFPVRVKVVRGATTARIFKNDRTLLQDFIEAGKELENDGCRAISGACGYFANFQRELAENLNVPVFASALLQAPWIKAGLKRNQKVGVLCAKSDAITPEMLSSVGIEDPSYLAVKGLEKAPQFETLVNCKKFEFRNSIMRSEVVNAAVSLAKEENLGAILLECSDLPPYSSDIQRAVNLPVFDYITMHRWIHYAVMQKPYCGFI